MIGALLALSACAPTSTPTAASETPTPSQALPTAKAAPQTPTLEPQGRTLLVTSAADGGPGTLRQALQDAQSGDTITFDPTIFPPESPVTIFIAKELPHIRQGNLTIDASNAGVILDGRDAAGEWLAGLQIVDSDANTIQGLQVANFSGPGIAIAGEAQYNLIGGDRGIGSGPTGQGNMISLNDIGIHLKSEGTSLNTIKGNLIGTNADWSEGLGNNQGILIEIYSSNTIGPDNIIGYNNGLGVSITMGAAGNTVGPDNNIAYNREGGIWAIYPEIMENTFIRNNIHDKFPDVRKLAAPIIFEYDLPAGFVSGSACPNCTVEIFSGESEGGAISEGITMVDRAGIFTFAKGSPFTGPQLFAMASDPNGLMSQYSRLTSGSSGFIDLQQGNDLPRSILQPKESRELVDNRLSTQAETAEATINMYDWLLAGITSQGVKHIRLAFNDFELPFDPAPTEFFISPMADEYIDSIISNGISIDYVLTFWDKEFQTGGGEVGCARFKAEAEIQRYLEYVRFIVRHFRERIQYFEIWNEPDNPACTQGIEVADYVELVKQVVPAIRQENPEAQIIIGAATWLHEPFSQDYLFTILSSDVMPMVDGVSWHPFYGQSPQYPYGADYYNTYSSFVQRIKDTASAAGFRGEYRADELAWRTPLNVHPDHPWVYSEIIAAKYHARAIILHLGMDIIVAGGADDRLPIIGSTLRNLATLMAGATPIELEPEIGTSATNIMSYGFSLANGDRFFALWTNGIAVDDDPGIPATLTFPGISAQNVIGIDVLHSFEQELIAEAENGNLVIRNLLVKDYPIILRLTGR